MHIVYQGLFFKRLIRLKIIILDMPNILSKKEFRMTTIFGVPKFVAIRLKFWVNWEA